MQPNYVKAFRQRLIRSGFTDVTIDIFNGVCFVSCLSPDGERVRKHLTESEVRSSPRRIYVL